MLFCMGNSMIRCTSSMLKDYKKWEENNNSECKNILFFKKVSPEATVLWDTIPQNHLDLAL